MVMENHGGTHLPFYHYHHHLLLHLLLPLVLLRVRSTTLRKCDYAMEAVRRNALQSY